MEPETERKWAKTRRLRPGNQDLFMHLALNRGHQTTSIMESAGQFVGKKSLPVMKHFSTFNVFIYEEKIS